MKEFPDGFFNIFFHNIKKEEHTVESIFFKEERRMHFNFYSGMLPELLLKA